MPHAPPIRLYGALLALVVVLGTVVFVINL